jgi:hypothetical protein
MPILFLKCTAPAATSQSFGQIQCIDHFPIILCASFHAWLICDALIDAGYPGTQCTSYPRSAPLRCGIRPAKHIADYGPIILVAKAHMPSGLLISRRFPRLARGARTSVSRHMCDVAS